jgi:sodium/hydrogen antiporter
VAVDVVWSIAGGLAIGGLLGTGLARGVLHLRREHKEAVGLDDFLALGLIAITYGLALLAHTYWLSRRNCGRTRHAEARNG